MRFFFGETERGGGLLMTPSMREAMRSTSFWSEWCLDLIRTAVLSKTVSIALRPANRIVSPDSEPLIVI